MSIYMKLSAEYRHYREIGKNLNGKILSFMDAEKYFIDVVSVLKISFSGSTLFLEHEYEMDFITDYFIFDFNINGRNPVQIFKENEIIKMSDEENELIESYICSYCSLFKVVSVDKSESVLYLYDLLSDEERIIKIIDFGFSSTAEVGVLIFIRVISVSNFNMTSGVVFVFRENIEFYLLRQYKKFLKKTEGLTLSAKRFLIFYLLNRSEGDMVIFK